MASKRPVIVAITSDIHAGSTLGACPADGVRLDDGGMFMPSKPQVWLHECMQDYWATVAKARKELKAGLTVVYNGDLFDGPAHHGTPQCISSHPEPQMYLATTLFGIAKALVPDKTYIVRGTEAHVGPAGATEEAFAAMIGAEKNHDAHRYSWWHLRLNVNGTRFDFQHHPSTKGTVPWTAAAGVAREAFRVWTEHKEKDLDHPHIVIRSHTHVHRDSFDAHRSRAIITPAFQLKTSFGHKVASASIADIGGIYIICYPDGTYDVRKKLYLPALPPLLEVA